MKYLEILRDVAAVCCLLLLLLLARFLRLPGGAAVARYLLDAAAAACGVYTARLLFSRERLIVSIASTEVIRCVFLFQRKRVYLPRDAELF